MKKSNVKKSNSKVMTIPATADFLGISKNLAYAAARAGQLPIITIGNRTFILRSSLERMLEDKAAHQ